MNSKRPKRLRSRTVWDYVFFAGMTLGLGAALIAARPVAPPAPEVQLVSEDDSILIPVPARTIARGEQLSHVDFISIRWPKSKLPPNYLTSTADQKGAYALSSLPAHLPIPLAALSSVALDANAVAEAIPAGMRAITVKVDAESAVEGWARSGNFIDVILVRGTKDSAGGLESIVIAENVKILSAGASSQPIGGSETAAKAPNTVTLLVSQEDALRVKTSATIGRLTFALRGTGDAGPTLTTSLDQRKIFGPQSSEQKPPEFTGRARGPDGRTYVLARNSKWLRSSAELTGFPAEPSHAQ